MLEKIKYFFEQSWLLMVSSVLFGLLLAFTNTALAPRIAQNQANKFNALAEKMLAGTKSFKTEVKGLPVKSKQGKIIETDINKAFDASGQCTGWAFEAEGPGFADKITLVITVDAKFEKIMGYGVLGSNETPGFGDQIKDDYFRKQFEGVPAQALTLVKTGNAETKDTEIVSITGATVSSEAVVSIMNNCLSQVKEQLQNEGLITNE
jgi:electron transport complex protein RnfG